MRTLVVTSSFRRTYQSVIQRRPDLRSRIEERLKVLATDPFHPSLRSHTLKGPLAGAWSCTVEYDCRIVFNLMEHPETHEKEVLLIDIGSHDEV